MARGLKDLLIFEESISFRQKEELKAFDKLESWKQVNKKRFSILEIFNEEENEKKWLLSDIKTFLPEMGRSRFGALILSFKSSDSMIPFSYNIWFYKNTSRIAFVQFGPNEDNPIFLIRIFTYQDFGTDISFRVKDMPNTWGIVKNMLDYATDLAKYKRYQKMILYYTLD
jgi:hypothetical protein